uniref:Uncharacterized protein n=1 Tax=Tetradesmus obliquus TaxID=3088 RepID=A0A383W215_TETOB
MMSQSRPAADFISVVLLASLLASSVVSTYGQSTTAKSTKNASSGRPACPVKGENYCVCEDNSCGGCPECAGCKDTQCIAPPKRWTHGRGPRVAGGSGRRLRGVFTQPAIFAARATSRSLAQAGSSALVCDGTVRPLAMPAGRYPTGSPWNPPFNNQPGFTCQRSYANPACADPTSAAGRRAINSGDCCGSAASTTCDSFSFAPITSASGGARGIVNPEDPITYQVTAADSFLTYVEFTAIDVGTAGARLAGGYENDVIPAVAAVHSWTPNGAVQAIASNGSIITTYGACSNCQEDKGIKTLSVSALPGTGFTRIELSQAFDDVGCSEAGSTGINADGMLWSGMRYSCVAPTCKDINLTVAGNQAYNCAAAPGPLSYVYNPDAADSTTLTVQSCCLPITCGDTLPLTFAKDAYDCVANAGPGYRPKAGSEASAPNNDNCCEFVPTCGLPAVGGSPYSSCAAGYTYDSMKATNTTLTSDACCKYVPTCAKPTADATAPYSSCAAGYTYDSTKATNTTLTSDACCKYVPTCAKPTADATAPYSSCAAGYTYDSTKATNTTLTSDACCKYVPTCAKPTADATAPYSSCAAGYTYDSTKATNTTLTSDACCKYVPTCAKPTADATAPYSSCAAGYTYDSTKATNTTLTSDACCKFVPTCAKPTADATEPYSSCAAGYTYDSTKATNTTLSNDACCKYVPTCAKPTADATAPYSSCAAGYSTKATNTTLTSDACCKYVPTCAKPTADATAPYSSCAAGYTYDSTKATNTTLSNDACCKYVPTCAKPTADAMEPYSSCAAGYTYDSIKATNTTLTSDACCKYVPTCAKPTADATAPYSSCAAGYTYDSTKATNTTLSNDACCMALPSSPSPQPGPIPTPDCNQGQCPAPATVNALLPQGFAVSSSSGSTVTVTYTNNAFLKCDCTQGLSWLTIATCGSTSSSTVNCARITAVRLGDQVTLSNVACGAVIDVIVHDGQCKGVKATAGSPAAQSPQRVALSSCKAGTTLPNGCRSGDSDGACGGAYSYRVVCSGARPLLRKLYFY